MSENAFPAIIALLGVLISVVASVIVSIRQFRNESQKLRNEYLHLYAGKLFDKRMIAYPQIFEPVVFIIERINLSKPISPDELEKFGNKLLDWNPKNSHLLSAHSEQLMHRLYIDLNSMTKEERETLANNHNSLKELKGKLLEFYLALKGDLGVYALVSPSVITEFKAPVSIKDVARLSESGK